MKIAREGNSIVIYDDYDRYCIVRESAGITGVTFVSVVTPRILLSILFTLYLIVWFPPYDLRRPD